MSNVSEFVMDAFREWQGSWPRNGSTEQIISKLREAEVELARGLKVPQVCKKLEVTEQTYYRWRKRYGGLRMDQAKRLKELERENTRLKKLLVEAELDKAILREAASPSC